MTTDADVIVVGAGIAGLVAAHELTSRGKKVALVDQADDAAVAGEGELPHLYRRDDDREPARALPEDLRAYMKAASTLPPWRNDRMIAEAEAFFLLYGLASSTLLACASLLSPDAAAGSSSTDRFELGDQPPLRAFCGVALATGVVTGNGRSPAATFHPFSAIGIFYHIPPLHQA